MAERIILPQNQFNLTIQRLSHQLIEVHQDFSESVIIGIQPRGVYLSSRIHAAVSGIMPSAVIHHGKLDFTLYRDDLHQKREIIPLNETKIDFSIENKNVILVDDVLFTGRTIRAALDALMDYGRPKDIELLVLIDRRLQRHVPIQAKYVGKTIDSIVSEKVKVHWNEVDGKDEVVII